MSLFNFDYRTSKLVLASAALALTGGVIGAGCGGADVSTLGGFCQALATADCSYAVVQACYGSTDEQLEQDTNSCIAARSQGANCNPEGLPYHSDFADNCIAAHTEAYANASLDRAAFDAVREACLPVFNRAGQKGQACVADSDCEVGAELRCVLRLGGKGTCQLPIPVPGGESCKDAAAQCPVTQFCDSGFHCVARPVAGESCGEGQTCAIGFRCNELSGKCIAQNNNGTACKLDGDCNSGFCLAAGDEGLCSGTYQLSFGSATCSDFR